MRLAKELAEKAVKVSCYPVLNMNITLFLSLPTPSLFLTRLQVWLIKKRDIFAHKHKHRRRSQFHLIMYMCNIHNILILLLLLFICNLLINKLTWIIHLVSHSTCSLVRMEQSASRRTISTQPFLKELYNVFCFKAKNFFFSINFVNQLS